MNNMLTGIQLCFSYYVSVTSVILENETTRGIIRFTESVFIQIMSFSFLRSELEKFRV